MSDECGVIMDIWCVSHRSFDEAPDTAWMFVCWVFVSHRSFDEAPDTAMGTATMVKVPAGRGSIVKWGSIAAS
jgi:hypothetical protein